MKTVRATAPGKVILCGEHAVVYGRPAIAVPLCQRAATATLEAGGSFRLVAPDIEQDDLLDRARPDDPLAAMVRLTLQHLGVEKPPQLRLTIRSALPVGRGLGSGAAVSTAIGRVLAAFYGRSLSPADVSALVYEVEKLHHGTPSGIDNTVVSFEQPVYFIKGRPIRRLRVGTPFTLVIGDTGVIAPTGQVVGDLRRRRQADSERYDGYFDEIETIVNQARMAIEEDIIGLAALGKLMDQNQEILATLGVSSPDLERLIAAARRAGALGAKLSGAGGGGNMIALARPETAPQIAAALRQAKAAEVIITEVS